MKKVDYLLPPGQEICAGSAAEAFTLFRSQGIDIDDVPLLAMIQNLDNEKEKFFVWVYMGNDVYVLSLFPLVEVPTINNFGITYMRNGAVIMYKGRHTYEVGYDKRLGRTVQKINLNWHERYAIAEASILGNPQARFKLCRLYLTAENSRLFTYCWVGYESQTRTLLFVKLFDDDWGLLAKHSYTEFGRKAVDVGERFETHGQHFVLREDKDGFLFLEKAFYNPYMKIVSMNHEVRQR